MNKVILTALMLASISSASAYQIEVNGCYSIDGIANVRGTPQGKITARLADGVLVRVTETKNRNWFYIKWIQPEQDVGECPNGADAGLMSGWTYVDNLLPVGAPLSELVKSGRVHYVGPHYSTGFTAMQARFLGTWLPVVCEEDGDSHCQALLMQPYEITLYCLNGQRQRNRIVAISSDSIDAGSLWLSLQLEREKPGKHCLIVDGAIGQLSKENRIELQDMTVDISSVCEERENRFNRYQNNEFVCSVWAGDLGGDGEQEVIVSIRQITGAPTTDEITLYHMMDEGGRLHEYGVIHADSTP